MIEAIAVHTVYYAEDGEQKIAKPGERLSLSESDFADLERLGAVKGGEGAEKTAVDPLDHDGNGKKGGSRPRRNQQDKPAAPAAPAAAQAEPAAELSEPAGEDDNAMIG